MTAVWVGVAAGSGLAFAGLVALAWRLAMPHLGRHQGPSDDVAKREPLPSPPWSESLEDWTERAQRPLYGSMQLAEERALHEDTQAWDRPSQCLVCGVPVAADRNYCCIAHAAWEGGALDWRAGTGAVGDVPGPGESGGQTPQQAEPTPAEVAESRARHGYLPELEEDSLHDETLAWEGACGPVASESGIAVDAAPWEDAPGGQPEMTPVAALPGQPERLADTGDIASAHLLAAITADLNAQDADTAEWLSRMRQECQEYRLRFAETMT
jgi:hypothetical protein